MASAEQVEAAILALEAQRGNLGDAVVEVALVPLRAQLAALRAEATRAEPMRVRQVSVLFTDIVGSTALTAGRDAEDAVAIVSGALARFGALVEAQQGKVARFTGDGLKGIFGAEARDEHAAENAVRAGLAILAEARAYAEHVRATFGVESFAVRVGVDTGLVALGGGIEADNTAMGTTVNLAARLEQAAPAGDLLISHATYVHVRQLFDVVEQPPLLVKGYDTPLVTYLVQRARPHQFRARNRGVSGVDTPLIGRDAELARLLEAHDAVRTTRTLHAVTVIGEAGVGKSRLLHELQNALHDIERAGVTLLARAHPQLRMQPYGLLRQMLANHLGIADTDSADVARAKWCDGLAPAIETGEAQMLGHLVGFDFSAAPAVARVLSDARHLRDRAFRALLAWLAACAARDAAPLLMVFDDLHWADEGSLSCVRHLMQNARGLALFLVLLARPALLETHPDWLENMQQQRLDVAPLGAEASRVLAAALLQKLEEVPPALFDLLARGAGNPFYMEELVNMLIDDGVIVRSSEAGGRWRVMRDRLRGIKVPPTLMGVLQARIDALAPPERTTLQHASVIGPVFWDAALEALAPKASASIEPLTARQMTLRKEPSAFADCSEYAFSHHLLHQATYDTVLKAARRAGHARAAAWLAQRVRDNSLEHLAATADHFERAGDRAQAAHYFTRAAFAAADRYANDAALELARRALDNLDASDRAGRFKLLRLRHRVLDVLGDYGAAAADLDEMAALYPPGTAPQEEAEIAYRRALIADRSGDYKSAGEHARAAIKLAEAAAVSDVAAGAYGEWAFVLTQDGAYEQAREKAALGLEHARRSGDALTEAQLLAIAANIEQADSNAPRCVELLEQAISLADTHGHVRLAGILHGNLAQSLHDLADFESALAHFEANLRIAREMGHRVAEQNALGGMARSLLALGRHDAALSAAREAVAHATAIGDKFGIAHWNLSLGDALFAADRLDEAMAAYGEAQRAAIATGARAATLDPPARMAEVALARGDAEEALRLLEPVLAADAVTLDTSEELTRICWIAFRVLQAAGDARAPAWLESAHRQVERHAALIPEDAARERYRTRFAHHREIREAYAAHGGAAPAF